MDWVSLWWQCDAGVRKNSDSKGPTDWIICSGRYDIQFPPPTPFGGGTLLTAMHSSETVLQYAVYSHDAASPIFTAVKRNFFPRGAEGALDFYPELITEEKSRYHVDELHL